MRSLLPAATAILVLAGGVAASPQMATRTIYVSALAKNVPVTDMTAADFVVKEDGKVRDVTAAQIATTPMSIALMLDNGGLSLGAIRQGAGQFIEALQGKAEFSIVTIGGRKLTLVDFSSDIPALYAGLKSLLARNTTTVDLLDGFIEVSNAFRAREAARPVIVAIAAEGEEVSNTRAPVGTRGDSAQRRKGVLHRPGRAGHAGHPRRSGPARGLHRVRVGQSQRRPGVGTEELGWPRRDLAPAQWRDDVHEAVRRRTGGAVRGDVHDRCAGGQAERGDETAWRHASRARSRGLAGGAPAVTECLRHHRRRGRALLGLAALVWATSPGHAQSPQTPAFRAAVELVAVDVQIIDRQGRPVLDIDPARFEVTIDGKRRRLVSVDLIAHNAGSSRPREPIGAGPVASNTWPTIAGQGRTFILAIDASSLEPGAALSVVQAAREFVARVEPADRVGIYTFPFGPRLSPTTDRHLTRQALDAVSGQRPAVAGQFNLSTAEIIDIAAETGGMGASSRMSSQVAAAGGRGAPTPVANDLDVLQRVQLRECRRLTDLGCLESIVSEAAALAQHLEERVLQGLTGLGGLLEALGHDTSRKTVVVMSGGMAVSDRPGARVDIGDEARELGERAAQANAVVYAIHIDRSTSEAFSAQSRRSREAPSPARERAMASKLLSQFADTSGGTLLTTTAGSGEIALDRILRETSAFYLLGVEPMDADRDGRVHRLQVKVNARDVTVRSRQWVVLRRQGR